MLEKIPDTFSKKKESKTAKLFKLIADEMEELRQTLNLIESWRDIDLAGGEVLGRIGNNVQEKRRGKNDTKYRQFIKTKIIANRSKGDVETLNEVAEVFIGDKYIGIIEGWQASVIDNEDASIIVVLDGFYQYNTHNTQQENEEETKNTLYSGQFKPSKNSFNLIGEYKRTITTDFIPYDAFKRTVAAGVKVYWLLDLSSNLVLKSEYLNNKTENRASIFDLNLKSSYEKFNSRPHYTNTFKAGQSYSILY